VQMRSAARRALEIELEQEGIAYSIHETSGRGIVPGVRFELFKGQETEPEKYAVRTSTSHKQILGFTRRRLDTWRTLGDVDYVLAAVRRARDAGSVEVLAFEAGDLREMFDKALAEMRRQGNEPPTEAPIFIPLGRPDSRVGHQVGGLRKKKSWSRMIDQQELAKLRVDDEENDLQSFKRRVAQRNRVHISKVRIKIEIED